MHRRTAHRGIAALALVSMLTLLGAQPASAADLGLLDRLASFWSAAAPGAPSLWDDFTGWLGFGTQTKANSALPAERGFGIDPNGLVSEPATPGPLANGAN